MTSRIGAINIVEPLELAINCCLLQGIFPDNAQIASIVPFYKAKPEKYERFSTIYEKVIKNLSVSYFGKYFLPFI